jgi:hypothetical protein
VSTFTVDTTPPTITLYRARTSCGRRTTSSSMSTPRSARRTRSTRTRW